VRARVASSRADDGCLEDRGSAVVGFKPTLLSNRASTASEASATPWKDGLSAKDTPLPEGEG
jgi:hypothetical protein